MKISKKQIEEFRKALITNFKDFIENNDSLLNSEMDIIHNLFPEVDEEDYEIIWSKIKMRSPKTIADFAYPKYLKGTNRKKKK